MCSFTEIFKLRRITEKASSTAVGSQAVYTRSRAIKRLKGIHGTHQPDTVSAIVIMCVAVYKARSLAS